MSRSAIERSGNRAFLSALKFDERGLVPAVIQNATTKQVLTLCYLNRAALRKSLEAGTVYVFRRSQRRLMQKGETSGHIQRLRELRVDCEGKSLLLFVSQHVAACHAGYFTCYYRRVSRSGAVKTVGRKVFDPEQVYQPRSRDTSIFFGRRPGRK